MGHPNRNYLCKLEDMAVGLKFNKSDVPDFCEICVESKHTRKPFQSRSFHKRCPLEIVHSDVCGPITPTSWNGKRYFLTFIDDYTHYTVVFLLENKS